MCDRRTVNISRQLCRRDPISKTADANQLYRDNYADRPGPAVQTEERCPEYQTHFHAIFSCVLAPRRSCPVFVWTAIGRVRRSNALRHDWGQLGSQNAVSGDMFVDTGRRQ